MVLRDSQGRLFPSCAEVRSRWPDGSIRWALLDAQIDVKAMEQADLTISYGEQTQPAAQLKSPLRATDRGDAIDVATGTLLARLGKSGSRLFVSVSESRHEYLDLSSETADLRAWNEAGQAFDGVVDTACIDDANPLRVVVLAHGGFVAEQNRLLSWISRVCFFAHNSTVRAYVTIVHDQDRPEIHLQRVSLALPLALGDAVQATAGSNSGLWQFDDAVEVSRDAPLEMTQSNVERHHIRHSTPAIVVDRRSNCMGWLQVADADHAVSLKVRRPWQSFPKRWWTDGRQIGVDLYADLQQSTGGDRSPAEQRYTEMGYEPHPAHDKPLCGCRKEWRARMSFSCTSVFPQTVEDRSINGLWLRRCHCFCSCHHSDSPIQGSLATSNPFESNCGPWSCACDNFVGRRMVAGSSMTVTSFVSNVMMKASNARGRRRISPMICHVRSCASTCAPVTSD
jgi:hypothetical protein